MCAAKKEKNTYYYPAFLNLIGKRCLVVGGGQVALRKVKTLLQSGAIVDVVSPVLCSGLLHLIETGKIHLIERNFQKSDIQGAVLMIVATDQPSTNLLAGEAAKAAGVMVNIADDPADSDFIVPSSLRRGDFIIAISTSGRSPALARKIRTKIEDEFGDEYNVLASMVEDVRLELKQRHLKASRDDWQKALDLDRLLDLLKNGEKIKARELLRSNLGLVS